MSPPHVTITYSFKVAPLRRLRLMVRYILTDKSHSLRRELCRNNKSQTKHATLCITAKMLWTKVGAESEKLATIEL